MGEMALAQQSERESPRMVGMHGPKKEGEDGLFTQSWFPICASSDVGEGEVKGFDFLDGRVIVMRDQEGKAQVLSAYCPHLGASLCSGEVVDGAVRCPFHFWRYAANGECVSTGSGDPVPPTAKLFHFPTVEKYGVVLAFNGTKPLFDLPDFKRTTKPLRWKIGKFERPMPADPWVICCNTPDMQHITVVHGITFDGGAPHDRVEWTDHSMCYRLRGTHRGDIPIDFDVGIFGTNVFYQEGEMDGRWFGFMAPMGLPRPGVCELFFSVAVEDDPEDPEGAQAFLDAMYDLEVSVATEDLPIIERARFQPGTLTKSDRTLGRFLKYLRKYPRAHPSAPFIR